MNKEYLLKSKDTNIMLFREIVEDGMESYYKRQEEFLPKNDNFMDFLDEDW